MGHIERKYSTTDLLSSMTLASAIAATTILDDLNEKEVIGEKPTLMVLMEFISITDKCQGAIMAVFTKDYEGTMREWKVAVKERVLDTELANYITDYIYKLPTYEKKGKRLVEQINELKKMEDLN